MRDGFLSLAQWFAPPAPQAGLPPPGLDDVVAPAATLEGAEVEACEELDEALAAIRRFRAALADALDAALDTLLRDVAVDVVGRELQLAPSDLRAIVRRACERYRFDEPLRIRVHPSERAAFDGGGPAIIEDASLRRGDVVIEIASGTIDATLGARLDRVIAAGVAR